MTDTVQARTEQPVIRALTTQDEAELRRLFRETMVMGSPLPFLLADDGRYESLCLDWYLGSGRDNAAVVDAGGRIVGFTLVCTDQAAYRRWVRLRAARYALYSVTTLLRTNPRSPLSRFHRCRLRDGWVMMRSPAPPYAAHAHVNVLSEQVPSWVGGSLLERVDEMCREAGLTGWYGEINAVVGKRARALERVVGPIVHRAPNHTLTWLMAQPVERLTVTRPLSSPGAAAA